MRNRKLHKLLSALLVASLLLGTFASLAVAADEPAEAAAPEAPALLEAATVAGTLTGGQFAKIWLGFTPTTRDSNVRIVAEWDRDNPNQNGLTFFVLDPSGLASVVAGGALIANNIASGTPVPQGPANQQQAIFRASGMEYTIVVANDSAADANFTLRTADGLFSDDSNQVRDPNAVATEAAPAEGAPAEAAPAETMTDTVAATPEPAATTETTTTVTATTVTTTTTVAAAEATPAAVTTVTTVTTPVELRATEVQGSLPEQNDQHYLALVPDMRDGEIKLTLTFDPQDSSELARRLNFWVLNNTGFQSFVAGTPASELAIAAGSRSFSGQSNERVAIFNMAGMGPYTVIVYNNSQVPATYTLRVTGGLLIDDSAQTDTAKALSAGAVVTGTVASTATVAAPAAPAATTTTTTTAAAATTGTRQGTPGGTYTVVAGDTVALIARDIYGDYTLYDAICRFNNLADCARIEIGDVLQLPTREQIAANATAPAAAPAAAATTAPAPAAAATPAATAAPAATTAAPAATATTTSTTTGGTSATLPTATPAAGAGTGTAAGDTILDLVEDNSNFTILAQALEATGLADELGGAGAFTVFAPTDAAFNALGAATVDALLKDTRQLTQILLFHVVNDTVMSDDLSNGLEATTMQGSPIEFTLTGATAKVQDSNIISPDNEASNGVVHIIDKVMLPPAP